MEENPSKLVPALIGGCVIGVLSTLPIINMGNCLCCMWILLGGVLGAYLYRREFPPGHEFSSREGAVVGFLSGIFGALFFTFLTYFFWAVVGFKPGHEFLQSILESRGDISPEIEEFIGKLQEKGGLNPLIVFVQLLLSLIIYSIFGTIGGIIGASIFKKRGKRDEPAQTETSE